MNVLIFVMTMLMLLSLMTYARLDSYRSSQTFQQMFKHYMQEEERSDFNTHAEKVYQSIKVSQNGGKPKSKIDATPRIPIGLLFDKNRNSKEKEWAQTQVLIKNLMQTLYEDQPFYKEIQEDRPSFIDELLKEITNAVEDLPDDKKPKTAVDLANLKLQDTQLDRILYKMLHGAFYENEDHIKEKLGGGPKYLTEKSEIDATVEEGDIGLEINEFKSSEGYYSLLDFVSSSSQPKIRVFLASKEVLLSLFPDLDTVEAIITERERLYHQAIANEETKELEEKFKNHFLHLKRPNIEDATLNFSITKTNPKYYQ